LTLNIFAYKQDEPLSLIILISYQLTIVSDFPSMSSNKASIPVNFINVNKDSSAKAPSRGLRLLSDVDTSSDDEQPAEEPEWKRRLEKKLAELDEEKENLLELDASMSGEEKSEG